jgi:hypothetical protein
MPEGSICSTPGPRASACVLQVLSWRESPLALRGRSYRAATRPARRPVVVRPAFPCSSCNHHSGKGVPALEASLARLPESCCRRTQDDAPMRLRDDGQSNSALCRGHAERSACEGQGWAPVHLIPGRVRGCVACGRVRQNSAAAVPPSPGGRPLPFSLPRCCDLLVRTTAY